MTDAQVRTLLLDCLRLWQVEGKITAGDIGLVIETQAGSFTVTQADPDLRPLRWFYQTPQRAAALRPPRGVPSVVALLSGLRNVMSDQ